MDLMLTNLDFVAGFSRVGAWLAADVYLDFSAIISGVIFLLFWISMKFLVFDPYVKIVREREARIEGERDTAASMEIRADEALRNYEKRLKEAQAEASELRAELRDGAERRRAALVSEARDEGRRSLEERRAELKRELEVAERSVETTANALSKVIVDRILTANG